MCPSVQVLRRREGGADDDDDDDDEERQNTYERSMEAKAQKNNNIIESVSTMRTATYLLVMIQFTLIEHFSKMQDVNKSDVARERISMRLSVRFPSSWPTMILSVDDLIDAFSL